METVRETAYVKLFDKFCQHMYTENQIERNQWGDAPITFEEYMEQSREFLKSAYEKVCQEKSGGKELE